jgi:hypothetical protein
MTAGNAVYSQLRRIPAQKSNSCPILCGIDISGWRASKRLG